MRRKTAERRQTPADPIYHDVVVSKFVNAVMVSGKKNVARRLVYQAFDVIQERTSEEGVEVFRQREMLVHHPDALGQGDLRLAQQHRLQDAVAVCNVDRARIGQVVPKQHIHQSGFAGSILA